jgi:hypothetical protein
MFSRLLIALPRIVSTAKGQEWYNYLGQISTVIKKTLPSKYNAPPKNAFRYFFYRIASAKWFEYTMLTVIMLNVLLLCFGWYHQSGDVDGWTETQRIADYVFTSIYIVEIIVVFIAFVPHCFKNGWFWLDLVIVVVSVIGFFITFANVGKTFRVLRVFRLFKVAKSIRPIRLLFTTLWTSLPAMGNVFLTLFLIFFAYAVVGVALFGGVMEGNEVNRRANFHTFFEAMFLLFRCSTGEAWNNIMHDIMRATSDWACLYFICTFY